MQRKQPFPYKQNQSTTCSNCNGSGKYSGLAINASTVSICDACNGLGEVHIEYGRYHIDIVIQRLQEIITNKNKQVEYFRDKKAGRGFMGRELHLD